MGTESAKPEVKELDLKTDFNEILKAGYTVNLWNTAGSVRVAEILKRGDAMGHQGTSMYGYGADATATEALVRARDSFAKRELEGKDVMTREDIRDADAGYMTGAYLDGTFLDGVAGRSEITFWFEDERVVARMPSLTFGDGHFAFGYGVNMEQAIDDLQTVSGGKLF